MHITYYPKTLAFTSTFPVKAVAESGVTLTDKVTIETLPLYFPDDNFGAAKKTAYFFKSPLVPSTVTVWSPVSPSGSAGCPSSVVGKI